ncbi:hypothetical protein [Nocardioides sp.]|uniref:hypothetical protein n=1 Tax=Nocardioides sp. TaxID=35761 RepID=UPI00262A4F98|nr:hypothetical protein [Nocardioides sp.]MDI6911446.1 hypothetical protein [Nocardioides sp.]
MADGSAAPQVSDYRLAPAFAARFVGGLLVSLAVLLVVVTVLVVALRLPGVLLLAVAVVGAAATLTAAYVISQRVAVVHLGAEGYRVRLVRGAGVTAAGWREVEEAVTASPGGVPVVRLRLTEGRTTTIPVHALAADRDEFVRDLQRHLQHGQGLRPL